MGCSCIDYFNDKKSAICLFAEAGGSLEGSVLQSIRAEGVCSRLHESQGEVFESIVCCAETWLSKRWNDLLVEPNMFEIAKITPSDEKQPMAPSGYMLALVQSYLQPIRRKCSWLHPSAGNELFLAVLDVSVGSLLEFIKTNKFRVNQLGACQLSRDFQYLKEWLVNQYTLKQEKLTLRTRNLCVSNGDESEQDAIAVTSQEGKELFLAMELNVPSLLRSECVLRLLCRPQEYTGGKKKLKSNKVDVAQKGFSTDPRVTLPDFRAWVELCSSKYSKHFKSWVSRQEQTPLFKEQRLVFYPHFFVAL